MSNSTSFFSGHSSRTTLPAFDGMIKWRPFAHTITLSWVEESGTPEEVIMKFQPQGNRSTLFACQRRFDAFLMSNKKGIDRMKQFECVEKWHWEVWKNALRLWGCPMIIHEGPTR